MDTTAQLLTPAGKGGIAVISLRGPRAADLLAAIFRPMRSHERTAAGSLQLGHLLGADGQVLDEAVVEREDSHVTINIHGGPYVTHAVLELLTSKGAAIVRSSQAALERAHPRWGNPAVGREMLEVLPTLLSPLAVSAVAAQWSSGLSRLAYEAKESLNNSGSRRVTGPGFSRGAKQCPSPTPPRDKVESAAVEQCRGEGQGWGSAVTRPEGRACYTAQTSHAEVAAQLRTAAARLPMMLRLVKPAEVVLAGVPNSGKSTLANALSGRCMSIVHETPGTTRDWVRELVLIDGVPIWLTDTAGLWEAPAGPSAGIDAQAVQRALERVRLADLVIVLGETPPTVELPSRSHMLRVWPKADIHPPCGLGGKFDVAVSAFTSAGMDELCKQILRALGLGDFDPQQAAPFTERQAKVLLSAADAIDGSQFALASSLLDQLLSAISKEPSC